MNFLPLQELEMDRIRFRLSRSKNPPATYTDMNRIPLTESFNALYRHFTGSTYQFKGPETGDQTIEQYLNLLKAQWILLVLRNGELVRPI